MLNELKTLQIKCLVTFELPILLKSSHVYHRLEHVDIFFLGSADVLSTSSQDLQCSTSSWQQLQIAGEQLLNGETIHCGDCNNKEQ